MSRRPFELGLEGNIWTGKIMCKYLEKTYSIIYKSGIYDLLHRMNLTHQRSHADYGNADNEEQIKFLNDLKNSILQANEEQVVLKFDEFSINEKPTSFYGWAEKIRAQKWLQTNEKANDLLNAEYFFQANKKAKSEQIAAYFADLAKHFQDKNKKKIDVFLDRNSTHNVNSVLYFCLMDKINTGFIGVKLVRN